uniref:Death ligand signal enhancer n=1 Tax=Nothoprocta perdicaria TaxID=30464 RepID=A0A8C6YPX0_NOTPE
GPTPHGTQVCCPFSLPCSAPEAPGCRKAPAAPSTAQATHSWEGSFLPCPARGPDQKTQYPSLCFSQDRIPGTPKWHPRPPGTWVGSHETISQVLVMINMRAGHYKAAYTCFKLAADRGYSKAQFNVGLCYEHGRGTEKDLEKAAFYYYLAASNCHPMAQYRYARCLLCHRPESEWDSRQKAVTFLEQAAMAGITEAQAYLGVFYLRGLQPKEKRGLKYLLLAAKGGDSQSRYHVGVCYEKGLGVRRDVAEALRHYRQAAAAGSKDAQHRARAIEEEMEATWPCPSTADSSNSFLQSGLSCCTGQAFLARFLCQAGYN